MFAGMYVRRKPPTGNRFLSGAVPTYMPMFCPWLRLRAFLMPKNTAPAVFFARYSTSRMLSGSFPPVGSPIRTVSFRMDALPDCRAVQSDGIASRGGIQEIRQPRKPAAA